MKLIRLAQAIAALASMSFCLHSPLALASDSLAKDSLAQNLNNKHCSFAGDFAQSKHLAGLSEPLNSTGAFYYHCNHGVIWKTTSPAESSLVFAKSGAAHRVENGQVTKLGARQGRVLGKLLNDLIGGDIVSLEKQFEIAGVPLEMAADSATNSTISTLATLSDQAASDARAQDVHSSTTTPVREFSLYPRKKSLKRAFKQITLDFSSANSSSLNEPKPILSNANPVPGLTTKRQTPTVRITILDRHDQSTEISPTQSVIFLPEGNALQDCQLQFTMTESPLTESPLTESECATLIPLSN